LGRCGGLETDISGLVYLKRRRCADRKQIVKANRVISISAALPRERSIILINDLERYVDYASFSE